MDANHPKLKIRFVLYVHFVFAIFSVGFLLLLLVMTPLILIAPPSQKSANEWYVFPIAIIIFGFFSWVTVSLTRQRWGTLP